MGTSVVASRDVLETPGAIPIGHRWAPPPASRGARLLLRSRQEVLMGELTTADRKRALAEHKNGLQNADSRLGAEAWQWGSHLAAIQDGELWREDGAATFSAWCDDELTMSRRAAMRAIALTEHFTQEMASRFGSRRLGAALNYIELTGQIEKPGDILALQIRYRGENGKLTSVPFPKATLKQIEDACAALRESARAKAAKARQDGIDDEVRAQIEAFEKLLPEAPAGSVRGDRVQARKAKDGTMTLTVQGIPLADWAEYQEYRKAKG
jgi:hypothetical protein